MDPDVHRSPRRGRHDFDSPLPSFQNHCGIVRTDTENPFSPCSVNSMQLGVSPILTLKGLRNLRHGLLIVRNPFGLTYVFPNLLKPEIFKDRIFFDNHPFTE